MAESLQACANAGILPKNIIAMQGPFSQELNKAMYRQAGAEVVVMKNSGRLGGSDTKLAAAIEAGIYAVVIDRPQIKYKNIITECNMLINKVDEIAAGLGEEK